MAVRVVRVVIVVIVTVRVVAVMVVAVRVVAVMVAAVDVVSSSSSSSPSSSPSSLLLTTLLEVQQMMLLGPGQKPDAVLPSQSSLSTSMQKPRCLFRHEGRGNLIVKLAVFLQHVIWLLPENQLLAHPLAPL